jgi:hypothetical protein
LRKSVAVMTHRKTEKWCLLQLLFDDHSFFFNSYCLDTQWGIVQVHALYCLTFVNTKTPSSLCDNDSCARKFVHCSDQYVQIVRSKCKRWVIVLYSRKLYRTMVYVIVCNLLLGLVIIVSIVFDRRNSKALVTQLSFSSSR